MMIAIQYLEGGLPVKALSPKEARRRLRAAFDRLPLTMVLVGWDLPPYLVEACAQECSLHDADLYLWQPLLTAHGPFQPDPSWRVIALDDRPITGYLQMPEFTFICPNRAGARESVLELLSEAIASGIYQGVFFDRIRFPSPAGGLARNLGCFCAACRKAAGTVGIDLSGIQKDCLHLLEAPEGRRACIESLLSTSSPQMPEEPPRSLDLLMQFRQRSISSFVAEAARVARASSLKVGLDCFSPTLTRLVGQDLPSLSMHCDWIKVMTYLRANGPASLPFEIRGLADWLIGPGAESESAAMNCLSAAAEWPLPADREQVRRGGLSASILTEEIRRGRLACSRPLLAGIELVEMPGVAELSPAQIRMDAKAVLAGEPDGVVFSWDLLHVPLDRLRLANSAYALG